MGDVGAAWVPLDAATVAAARLAVLEADKYLEFPPLLRSDRPGKDAFTTLAAITWKFKMIIVKKSWKNFFVLNDWLSIVLNRISGDELAGRWSRFEMRAVSDNFASFIHRNRCEKFVRRKKNR